MRWSSVVYSRGRASWEIWRAKEQLLCHSNGSVLCLSSYIYMYRNKFRQRNKNIAGSNNKSLIFLLFEARIAFERGGESVKQCGYCGQSRCYMKRGLFWCVSNRASRKMFTCHKLSHVNRSTPKHFINTREYCCLLVAFWRSTAELFIVK